MALQKCPKCEVNYLRQGEDLCAICSAVRARVRAEESAPALCAECGEAPAARQELCESCYEEHRAQAELELLADESRRGEAEEPLDAFADDPADEE